MPSARTQLMPYARFDIGGMENMPDSRPGDRRRQPPQLLRPVGDGHGARQARPPRALPRQEGGVRRAGRRPAGRRRWAASASTAARAPTSRCEEAAAALARRRAGGAHAAGHDPARRGVLRPGAEGRWGAARLAHMTRRAGHPGRAVGHREGLAPNARLPNFFNVTNPPLITVRVGDAGRVEGRGPRRGHEADHGGHRRPAAARGARDSARRPPKSSPGPTRPARRPPPATTRRSAAPARTDSTYRSGVTYVAYATWSTPERQSLGQGRSQHRRVVWIGDPDLDSRVARQSGAGFDRCPPVVAGDKSASGAPCPGGVREPEAIHDSFVESDDGEIDRRCHMAADGGGRSPTPSARCPWPPAPPARGGCQDSSGPTRRWRRGRGQPPQPGPQARCAGRTGVGVRVAGPSSPPYETVRSPR